MQAGLGACGASLCLPGRLLLNHLIGTGNRQTLDNVDDERQTKEIIPNLPRFANVA